MNEKIQSTDLIEKNTLLAVVLGKMFVGYYEAANLDLREATLNQHNATIKSIEDNTSIGDKEKSTHIKSIRKKSRYMLNKYDKDINAFIADVEKVIELYQSHSEDVNDLVEDLVDNLNQFMDTLVVVENKNVSFRKINFNIEE